jgi:hypothetical protein
MPPRRSCFAKWPPSERRSKPCFNATTAFLLPVGWRRAGSTRFGFNATTAFLLLALFIPQDEELLSSPGKDLERDKDSWVRTSVGFDGYLTPFRSIRPLGVRGSLFRSPDHSHAMHPRRAIFLAQHRSKARRSVSLQRVIRSPFRGPPIGGFSMGIRARFLSGVNAGIRSAPAD